LTNLILSIFRIVIFGFAAYQIKHCYFSSIEKKKKKEKKSFKKTFICFCRKKLNEGKLDQINLELAEMLYSDYRGPNRTTYEFWGQLDIFFFGFKIQV